MASSFICLIVVRIIVSFVFYLTPHCGWYILLDMNYLYAVWCALCYLTHTSLYHTLNLEKLGVWCREVGVWCPSPHLTLVTI